MMASIEEIFAELVASTEVRKVDYKRDQYSLANEISKSEFIKDILCMANAAGGDGYILLDIKSEKGKPKKEVVGISHHHDSSDLEAIVNSVVDPPIQFEYYPVRHKGFECALIHIPKSKAKPHWPQKDYGKLRRHIFYTRRSSGNREASIQEIREMCIETMQLSDIAHRKRTASPHIVDELRDMSLDERKAAMYRMLKSIAPKLHLVNYYPITATHITGQAAALVTNATEKEVSDYCVVMYPWAAKRSDIIWTQNRIKGLIAGSQSTKLKPQIRERLKESTLVHVSYKNIHTKALEERYYERFHLSYRFANAWNEPWGKIVKWEATVPNPIPKGQAARGKIKFTFQTQAHYEFFIPNVTSRSELQDRLERLLAWTSDK